jgi:hypothetical protein
MKRLAVLWTLSVLAALAAGSTLPRPASRQRNEPAPIVRTMTVEGKLRLSPGNRRLGELDRGFLGRDVVSFTADVDEAVCEWPAVRVEAVYAGSTGEGQQAVRLWVDARHLRVPSP